ncbi:MAG: histidinol-phosphate transaminase [Gammaproteobacteria bacterium]|nr:histidinol-phosphate transaminase [Gammaproteobacteria bacterium]MDH5511679.1 histidinol-phosphate transaminase [Gammaproteobacteria bacterium]
MSIHSKVDSVIRPEVRALKAYHVPDATGLIKLDAMENPYSWPDGTRQAWVEVLRQVALNRYPDPDARRLRARLRAALAVPGGMELLLGNGSDELIQVILMAVSRPGAVVLAPTPTFVMYEMIATFTGMKFAGVPLAEDFALDMPAMTRAIAAHKPAVIFLSYPNNPTANLFAREDVLRVIGQAPGLVVLDEAYHAFAGESFMDQLVRHENLLVMRTLSKQGLAGLRLGVLAGPRAWLAELNKVRLPYNIGTLTQASAEFALTHMVLLDEQAGLIRSEREKLFQALSGMKGTKPWPSRTNFILFRVEKANPDTVFEGLRSRGVLIKNMHAAGGILRNCLRVTVGTPEENASFLEALEAVL